MMVYEITSKQCDIGLFLFNIAGSGPHTRFITR